MKKRVPTTRSINSIPVAAAITGMNSRFNTEV
jgi:hypothetical protein